MLHDGSEDHRKKTGMGFCNLYFVLRQFIYHGSLGWVENEQGFEKSKTFKEETGSGRREVREERGRTLSLIIITIMYQVIC